MEDFSRDAQRLRNANYSLTQIAKILNCSKSKVHQYTRKPIKREYNETFWGEHEIILSLPDYAASKSGQIWSFITDQYLKSAPDHFGYRRVGISINGHLSTKKVHRLVAEAFYGSPPEGRRNVNHINNDPSDNRPENLEWCNQKENMFHALNQNRLDCRKGTKNGNSLLTNFQVLQIKREIEKGYSNKFLSEKHGVANQTISAIKSGKLWKHINPEWD